MKQTPVRNGWPVRFELSWAVVAILLPAFFGATLTGCGTGVDSAEYEEILDQPETSPSPEADPDKVAIAKTEIASGNPESGTASSSPEEAALAGQPTDQVNADGVASPNSPAAGQDDPTSEPASVETPAEEPAEKTIVKNDGPTETPAEDSGSSTAKSGDADPEAAAPKVKVAEKKQPRIVKLLIPDKKFRTEGKGDEKALRVSFDDYDLLKVLNMDPVTEDAPSRMPKWLKDLDGKRIRVRGFMMPAFQEEDIRGFTLARDNELCCFGRNPLVYDLVDVFMRKGESTEYIQNRPFDVVGVFHIGDSIIPGELYSMDDAVVVDR
jgi:hypothetical protein